MCWAICVLIEPQAAAAGGNPMAAADCFGAGWPPMPSRRWTRT